MKEIGIDKIDRSCSALLMSTDLMPRGLHNSVFIPNILNQKQ